MGNKARLVTCRKPLGGRAPPDDRGSAQKELRLWKPISVQELLYSETLFPRKNKISFVPTMEPLTEGKYFLELRLKQVRKTTNIKNGSIWSCVQEHHQLCGMKKTVKKGFRSKSEQCYNKKSKNDRDKSDFASNETRWHDTPSFFHAVRK